jgi:hypothetical protein
MIGTIRKHQQWLWIIIILAIIVSFVVYFSPTKTGLFDSEGSYNFGSIKGRPIDREQFRSAQSEIVLFYFLRFGKWPAKEEMEQTGFNLERETYNRILLVEKLKELNVQPGSEATAKWIAEIFRGKEETTFPMERFDKFVQTELKPHNFTADDFYRFARHQIGQQHLISVYGLSGKLIAPQEAESFYRRLNEPFSSEAVFFSASNFLGNVSATATNLNEFFSKNMARYRLPERVQVNYVKWTATNFLADADKELGKVTNLSQQLEAAYFQSGGTNQFKDASGKPLSLEAAKNKIKEEQREKIALITAHKKAAEFVEALLEAHDEKNPAKPGDLEKFAKEKGLEIKTTAPFSEETSTNELKVPEEFIRAAFTLRPNDPDAVFTSRPVVGSDAVYVLSIKQQFPSENQPFEKVREQVTKDYKAQQSLKLARDAGVAFEKTLTNGVAQGKTFDTIAKEAKVKVVPLPQFSLSTRTLPGLGEHVNLDTLQNIVATLPVGKASDFVATADGGLVLHLKAKLPVDEARLKTELPEFLAHQRDQRMSAAYSEWFQKLPQEMNLVMPPKSSAGK